MNINGNKSNHLFLDTWHLSNNCLNLFSLKGEGADMPLFETIKTNAGTQPKSELQQ